MKVNLGCGGEHKKGYLNVDAFNKTIADKEMKATNLLFEDYSIDEILMSQVIEHLGIVGSIYTLSECFRVLKTNGKLVIETPDIRESFKIYLNGEREDRKYILPWIYGVDMPGMQHRFCFPDDLLEEELKKIGFSDIKKSHIQFDEHQPILRVECEKPKDDEVYQFITKVRKELLNKNILDLNEQISSLEKDDLVDFLKEKLISFYKERKEENITEMLLEGTVRSPEITLVFFEQVLRNNIIKEEAGKKYVSLIKQLKEKKFLSYLIDYIISRSGFIGETNKLFEETYNYGKEIVKKIINSNQEGKLDEIGKKESLIEIDFLSEKLVMLKSNQIFQKGVKAFNEGDYKKAIVFFRDSSALYRDQLLTFWNLGRLGLLTKNKVMANSNYKNAIMLSDHVDFKENNNIKKLIKEEMINSSSKICNESIISLENIYERILKKA